MNFDDILKKNINKTKTISTRICIGNIGNNGAVKR